MYSLGEGKGLKNVDYPDIKAPILLLVGDKDKMVTIEETVNVYRQLSNAYLGVLPNTPHLIEQVNHESIVYEIKQFMDR